VVVRAVVSRGGPPGSHLAEVARALAVPLVTGCPLSAPDGSLVTVDGGEGTVAIHAPA
jgi:signal transduction protein with GAF and PtsI domain